MKLNLYCIDYREAIKDRRKELDDSGVVEKVYRPVFKTAPQDQQVNEGSCVRLDCVVSARPQADVVWYRNGQPVAEDNLHKVGIIKHLLSPAHLFTSPALLL